MEIWKTCVVTHAYEVSNQGRVRSTDRVITHERRGYGPVTRVHKGRILRPGRRSSGHMTVVIKGRTYDVHFLVLTAFVGLPKAGQMCRHLDGNPANNKLLNLCWGTQGENMQDRKYHGSPTKLTVEQIAQIKRQLIDNDVSGRELARRYGVSKTTIQNINHQRVHVDVHPA